MTTFVLLPHGRAQFRRVLRDEAGQPLKDESGAERVLVFNPGEPVSLDDAEITAVRNDIGNALVIAKIRDGVAIGKQDEEGTKQFVDEAKLFNDESRKEREAEKQAKAESDGPVAKRSGRAKKVAEKKDAEKKDE